MRRVFSFPGDIGVAPPRQDVDHHRAPHQDLPPSRQRDHRLDDVLPGRRPLARSSASRDRGPGRARDRCVKLLCTEPTPRPHRRRRHHHLRGAALRKARQDIGMILPGVQPAGVASAPQCRPAARGDGTHLGKAGDGRARVPRAARPRSGAVPRADAHAGRLSAARSSVGAAIARCWPGSRRIICSRTRQPPRSTRSTLARSSTCSPG